MFSTSLFATPVTLNNAGKSCAEAGVAAAAKKRAIKAENTLNIVEPFNKDIKSPAYRKTRLWLITCASKQKRRQVLGDESLFIKQGSTASVIDGKQR